MLWFNLFMHMSIKINVIDLYLLFYINGTHCIDSFTTCIFINLILEIWEVYMVVTINLEHWFSATL